MYQCNIKSFKAVSDFIHHFLTHGKCDILLLHTLGLLMKQDSQSQKARKSFGIGKLYSMDHINIVSSTKIVPYQQQAIT